MEATKARFNDDFLSLFKGAMTNDEVREQLEETLLFLSLVLSSALWKRKLVKRGAPPWAAMVCGSACTSLALISYRLSKLVEVGRKNGKLSFEFGGQQFGQKFGQN